VFLSFAFPLSDDSLRRKDGASASSPSVVVVVVVVVVVIVVVVGEKIGARERGGRNFASASESAERASRRTEKAGERKVRRGEEEGQGAAVSMATRRGGNATVTMAAAGSSLGPTCLSLFLASRPPRSPHLDLFLPPTERASGPSGRRSSLEPIREGERWGGLGLARRERVFLCFFLPLPFRAASREFFFPRSAGVIDSISMRRAKITERGVQVALGRLDLAI